MNPYILKTVLEDAETLVVEGVEKGYIHTSDAENMVQDDTKPGPGRYYGLPKIQKSRKSWPSGHNIPLLRPIVSSAGMISKLVKEVKNYLPMSRTLDTSCN